MHSHSALLLHRLARRRRVRARGAAYVEAILLILFMIIIFTGVIYLGRYFDAKQQALGIARQCAWAFSKNACVNEADLPVVCQGLFGNGPDRVPDSELRERVKTAQQDLQGSKNAVGNDAEFRAGVEAKQGEMLELLVGQSVTAVATGSIEKPRSLPAAPGTSTADYYLPCNLAHQAPLPMALDLFKKLL